MATQHRIDPRVRAYGKARIDITLRAKDEQEWQQKWKDPRYSFPFNFGDSWKHCVEYRVDDFAAEVGFFMDVLGFPVQTFSPSFAIFTSPGQDFFISVVASPDGYFSTSPDAIRLQFRVEQILETVEELERRGVVFEQRPQDNRNGELITGYFRTPHGICIDLLGYNRPASQPPARPQPATLTVQEPEDEEEGDENGLDHMPLFGSPIEPDDPLFQFPKQGEENNGRRKAPFSQPASRSNRTPAGPQPPLPTSGERSSRLSSRETERRTGRSGNLNRPGQFRRSDPGRITSISRRSRYSIPSDSGPKTAAPEDPEVVRAEAKRGAPPETTGVTEASPKDRAAGKPEIQGNGRKKARVKAETRKLFEPIEEELPVEAEAPEENEPEEELHYEDLDDNEDYDLPY